MHAFYVSLCHAPLALPHSHTEGKKEFPRDHNTEATYLLKLI